MNGFRLVWWALPLLLAVLGCESGAPTAVPGERVMLSMTLERDTLYLRNGQTTTIRGTARLTSDWRPEGISGQRLEFSLAKPWGLIRFANRARRDTTDATGTVEFTFHAQASSHSRGNAVRAAWGTVIVEKPVWVSILPQNPD